ncbi:hypothetical protein ACFLU1_06130 [Chloroflexota bacterium]
MLKKDSNRLFQTLAREGFDPKLFTLEHANIEEDGFFDQIVLVGSPLRFFIGLGDSFNEFDYKYIRFAPNFNTTLSLREQLRRFQNLNELESAVVYWLENHVQPYLSELLEPDLWQQMQLETPLVTGEALTSLDTNQFTDEEKLQIKMSINEFKVLVINQFKPSAEKLELIEGRLAYLTEAVDRLNRYDWRSVAISAIISISVALTLDTEGGRLLFDLFTRAFSNIAGLLPPL